jgi:hypothetical protein
MVGYCEQGAEVNTTKGTRSSRFLKRSGRLHQAAGIAFFLLAGGSAIRTAHDRGTVSLTELLMLFCGVIWFLIGYQMVKADANQDNAPAGP